MSAKRESFGSRAAVVMAMAGSAIGLGNLWRFPYIVGENGGAAFIIVYIAATLVVSLPVFFTEFVIGRKSGRGAYESMSSLRPGKPFWKVAGFMCILTAVLICSYYSVIGGWSIDFLLKSSMAEFTGNSSGEVTSIFGKVVSAPFEPIFMHLLFLGTSAYIVARGVKSGIEKFSKICIPVLFFLILLIIVYSVMLPGAGEGVRYLVKPDFSQITPKALAYALGQSFYSLSLGMGAIITYGSYVHKDENIVAIGSMTAVSDLLFAILAGFAIMPAVFAAGLEPGAGTGLIFQSIPYIFSSMSEHLPIISTIISIAFFLAIVVAAMTSCISLLEIMVSFLNEKIGLSRTKASIFSFILCGGLGCICSLSFGPLSGIRLADKVIFDIMDWFCSNVMLLISALFFVIFVGFVMKKEDVKNELTNNGTKRMNVKLSNLIFFQIKWVAPIAIVAIFVANFIL